MKIGVLYNCQHQGLANGLQALMPDANVISYELSVLKSPELQEQAATALGSCDTVVCAPIDQKWGSLSNQALGAEVQRICIIPPISFAGFHPDMIYVITSEGHLSGATGPYHSRIVIASYLEKLSVSQTTELFNRFVFVNLGYLQAFEQAVEFLISRYKQYNVDLGSYIECWRTKGCFMHSINHPKIHVLCDLAIIFCKMMGIGVEENLANFEMVPDNLSNHPKHPVFPQIASKLGISGSCLFKPANDLVGRGFKVLPLDAFIDQQFATYSKVPREHLIAADGVQRAVDLLSAGK